MTAKSVLHGEIFIVDDDAVSRRTLSTLLKNAGYEATFFADGTALKAVARIRCPLCIVLDVHIPRHSGLELLKELTSEEYPAPIVVMSGHADIPMVVNAMQNGALGFIQKPFCGDDVLSRLKEAVAAYLVRQCHFRASPISFYFPGRKLLTRREREVLQRFYEGDSNKKAGLELGISPRTIEDHRATIMKKLGVKNAGDLLRLVMANSSA